MAVSSVYCLLAVYRARHDVRRWAEDSGTEVRQSAFGGGVVEDFVSASVGCF